MIEKNPLHFVWQNGPFEIYSRRNAYHSASKFIEKIQMSM